MSSFYNNNGQLINEIQVDQTNLNTSFSDMSGKLLTLLEKVDGIISPLVKIFSNLVGNSGLFSLINCCKLFFLIF